MNDVKPVNVQNVLDLMHITTLFNVYIQCVKQSFFFPFQAFIERDTEYLLIGVF